MEDFDVVTELRAKWCCILEEQLECPVCFEIGGSTEINQCLNGHNICSNCRIHLDDCPICHGQFSTMRNRTVETLIKQFQEMKSSLMDPEGDKHQRINKNKKSIGCQTDPAIEVVKLSIKCQTDSFIDTKTVEADILKNELNSLIVDTKNTQSLIKPKIELTVKEVEPPLRRSTRFKTKTSRYTITHH